MNAVAPGLIETPWVRQDGWDPIRVALEGRAPLGRVGTPENVAQVVVSLAHASDVTGQIVVVDGGVTIR